MAFHLILTPLPTVTIDFYPINSWVLIARIGPIKFLILFDMQMEVRFLTLIIKDSDSTLNFFSFPV